MASSAPRWVADLPLPPYAYVPGQTPQPTRDPAGHRFGTPRPTYPPLDPERWAGSRAYLYGIDLFNHGYYWEAHEVWEGLWHASGRRGATALCLKGLIALAAAGVKWRQHRPVGVRRHAARAGALFSHVAQPLDPPRTYPGLEVQGLIRGAAELAQRAERLDPELAAPLPLLLWPREHNAPHPTGVLRTPSSTI